MLLLVTVEERLHVELPGMRILQQLVHGLPEAHIALSLDLELQSHKLVLDALEIPPLAIIELVDLVLLVLVLHLRHNLSQMECLHQILVMI